MIMRCVREDEHSAVSVLITCNLNNLAASRFIIVFFPL